MDHLPTEVLQQIIFEIINNSNASSPQADLASFARVTKRISSIATLVLYRSIRLTDGRSAQLLVRTYLDGINPFALVKSTQFKRAELHELNLDYFEPLVMGAIFMKPAFAPDTGREVLPRRVANKRDDLPRLDVLASYGFLSNLTSLLLSNFTDELDLVPRLLGPGKPLRQQLKRLAIVHTEDEYGSIRDYFVLAFVLGVPALIDPSVYLLDCLIITAAELFATAAVPGDEDYLEPRTRLSHLRPGPPPPSVCQQACYDFETFASIYNYPSYQYGPVTLVKGKMASPSTGIRFDNLRYLRIRLPSQDFLPLVLNKATFPRLRELVLFSQFFYIDPSDVLLLRRVISRTNASPCGRIIGPISERVYGLNNEAVFGVEDISDDWPPLSDQQLKDFGDYHGVELDLLDLLGVQMEH